MITGLEEMTDQQVEAALLGAVRAEGKSTAAVLRCLIEFGERRRLHAKRAYPSLFEYCTKALGYGEEAAYKRTRVAHAAVNRPEILDLLEQGRTSLSKLVIVVAHLKTGPAKELLEKACSLKKRDLEFYVAGLAPKTPTRDFVRTLSRAAAVAPAAGPPAGTVVAQTSGPAGPFVQSVLPPIVRVEAITGELARIVVTVDRETVEKYDRACALLRVGRKDGGRVFAKAIESLLREIDPDIKLARKKARSRSQVADCAARHIPQHVQDEVWKRDAGQCSFQDENDNRCCARVGLQFDHIRPWSVGGRSDNPDNIRLLCELHNAAEARRWFGDDYVDRAIALSRKKQGRRQEAPA